MFFKKHLQSDRTGHSAAFTLIEIMIVAVVIATIAAVLIPRIGGRKPGEKWTSVLDEMNNLVFYARQEAISKQKIYRLHFQTTKEGKSTAQVEVEGPNPEKPGQTTFVPASSVYFKPLYNFPKVFKIKAVYHGHTEQFDEHNDHAYCYVIPDGLVQEVYVQLVKTPEEGKKEKKTFKIVPFFGRFEMLDGFVKQERN